MLNRSWRFWAAFGAMQALLWASPAAFAEGTGTSSEIQFSIAPGTLTSALTDFAQQSGLQFAYSADLTGSIHSQGLNGRMTPEEAVRQLLSGTGLTFRFVDAHTISIEKPNSHGAKLLSPVEVEGVQAAGANGSTDVTATEGTGSYTTSAVTIGSKAPLSMRETPQSVSVVTQQRIQEQNLTDLNSALNQATGVSLITTNYNLGPGFYSRGFQITSFQFDGGTPLDASGFGNVPLIDLAEYDHVELLRGADGMFAGAGNPGGAVNLARKRPLDHNQVIVEGGAGSWNNYRAMVDITGPLALAGLDDRVRGRLVVSYQAQDYFYDTAQNSHFLLYGVIEADLTPTTLLTVGGDFTKQDTVPWQNGLPRYQSGDDLRLPRETCLCASWNRWDFSNPNLFVRLEQNLGQDWKVKVNASDQTQSSDQKIDYVSGAVNPNTLMGPTLNGQKNRFANRQYLVDFTLDGSFTLFDRRHQLVVGANWQDEHAAGSETFPSLYGFPSPPVNVFAFNPASFPEPASPRPNSISPEYGQKQYGAYATLRIEVLDELHLLGGFRLSGYSFNQITQSLNPDGSADGPPSPFKYNDQGVLTPYGGVVLDFTKAWSAYASYTDIYSSQATNLQGPPPGTPLPPLRGGEYELGLKGELIDGALNTALSLYRINQKNAGVSDPNYPFSIGADGSSFCCYVPLGNLQSEGVDAEVTGQIMPGWQLSAGYTYDYTRDLTPGDDDVPLQTRAPKHLFKLWTSYQLPGDWKKLSIAGGMNAQSATYVSGSACAVFSSPTVCQTSMPYHFTQGGYAVFSGRIGYQLDDHWQASLNVNNILDKIYYQTVGSSTSGNWYGDPRNFMFTIRFLN